MAETKFIQLFVKLLDNKTLTLQFPTNQTLTPQSIKHQIETLTQIPTESQNLTLNGKFLNNNSTPIPAKSLSLSTLTLTFSLLGGKGGFGSLLRGAATKAGQKKTNNFDACRDISGRRLRHVNAEKKMEEWKAEEEERRLEKVAEEYLKKMAKKGKGGKKEDGAEKYVEKYREQSARCIEEVERSVRESVGELLAGGKKRKLLEKLKGGSEGVAAKKKLKIWMGKRKVGESDSDDSDDDDETDVENEKSVVTDNGNQSDSSKDASSGPTSVEQLDGNCQTGSSSDSGSEEEKEAVNGGSKVSADTPSRSNGHVDGECPVDISPDAEEKAADEGEKLSVLTEEVVPSSSNIVVQESSEHDLRGATAVSQLPSISSLNEQDGPQLETTLPEGSGPSDSKSASPDEGVTGSSNGSEVSQPLNFDDFNSAAELEALGMERLKSELQARGLKCGGTLQERAARLFLLKTTPLEKLPKKLLAKK